MNEPRETAPQRLRRRAELALERRRLTEAETLLDRLAEIADGEEATFAHRHLAELRLERHPWRAALHLRRVIGACPDDDVPHALMGLCQALLGNFRSAVASYQKALQAAPDTAWYLHNLGHLLDVALDSPSQADAPLTRAYELEPEHDEILASLAHCRARVGKLEDALRLAREALALAPRNVDHGRLVQWIEAGAPPGWPEPRAQAPSEPETFEDAVEATFVKKMSAHEFSDADIRIAKRLWGDFTRTSDVSGRKPEIFASAVEYAVAQTLGRGLTQAKVAERYGISANSLAGRYGELRRALDLTHADPRYRTP
ncbi:MAG: hypothetical protein AAGE52_04875 [Myxococcota bacterium]